MAEYDNPEMLGDDTLFAPDPVLKQRALAASVRRNPALAAPTSGVPTRRPAGGGTAGGGSARGGSPGEPVVPQPGTSEHTLSLMSERNKQPDAAPYVAHAQERTGNANRKLVLALALGAKGGESLSPFGQQLGAQAMKEGGDYDIPGGWGTVSPEGNVVWNTAKQEEAEMGRLNTRYNAQLAAEQRAAAARDANLTREVIAANKQPPSEPLMQVQNPDGSLSYVPRSQAAGLTPPPRPGAKPNGRALTTSAVDKIGQDEAKVDQFASLITSWKPEYGGLGTSLGNISGRYNPLASDAQRGQQQWWQAYQGFVNDMRHTQFGAALTPTEKAEFEKAIVTADTDPRNVAQFLATQHRLAQVAQQRRIANLGKAGFDVTGFAGEAPAAPPGAPAAPPTPGAAPAAPRGGSQSWDRLPP